MGLLRTAARAGVAAHVVGNVQRRQQQRWAAQGAPAAPQPAAPPVHQPPAPPAPVAPPQAAAPGGADFLAQLQQLGALRDSGVLTETEFEAQKARILAGA